MSSRQVSMQFGKPGGVRGGSSGGYSTEILTPTVTKISGNTTVDNVYAHRFGNVVELLVQFRFTGSVNSGSDALHATVSGIPLPIIESTLGSGYFSNSGLLGRLNSDGDLVIRVVGGNRSSSSTTAGFTIIYICE